MSFFIWLLNSFIIAIEKVYEKFFNFLQKTIDNIFLKVYLIGAVENFKILIADAELNQVKKFFKKF